jgi:hypothetical protein
LSKKKQKPYPWGFGPPSESIDLLWVSKLQHHYDLEFIIILLKSAIKQPQNSDSKTGNKIHVNTMILPLLTFMPEHIQFMCPPHFGFAGSPDGSKYTNLEL